MKIFVSGDIYNKFAKKQFVCSDLSKRIKESDYAICNFEGPLLPNNWKVADKVPQHASTLGSLKEVGFKMFLLSNNHITDFGKEGLLKTIDEIKKNELDYIGAGFSVEDVYKAKVIEIKGCKIGLINLCEAQVGHFVDENQEYGYAWIGHPSVEKLIERTSKQVDHLLLFVHAGLEHYDLPLVQFRKLYRRFCDLGADCVIATHPHISQGVEQYNDKFIFYSLGNFFFPRYEEAGSYDIENESFSIQLNFKDQKITYMPVFHRMDKLLVRIATAEQSKVKLEKLNAKLLEPEYSELLNGVCDVAYKKVCRNLYLQALMGTSTEDGFLTSLKYVLKYLFFRNKYWLKTQTSRNKLLLRLLQNESYKYLAEFVLQKP